jgi:hypothetical protein
MSTIKTTNLQAPSAASPAIVLASDGSATAQLSSLNGGALSGARNRIINGDMRIDQRNAGASVSLTTPATYVIDRWSFRSNTSINVQRSTTAPTAFTNSAYVTVPTGAASSSGHFNVMAQYVEGFNVSDLAWGSASAKAITLSFQVRSSQTGTFAGSIRNSAGDRSYVFTYSVSSANTWTTVSIGISGDTSGTWLTDNSIGLSVTFDLGSGSSFATTAGSWTAGNYSTTSGAVQLTATTGATFYITGVQLEAGTVATPFERRSYGQELALCQRYFVSASINVSPSAWNATPYYFPVTMRATPTVTGTGAGYTVSGSATNSGIYHYQNSFGISTVNAAIEL